MKILRKLAVLSAAAFLATACNEGNDHSGDYGQIKVPDTRELQQTASADDTQASKGVTFTTDGAWTSTITSTRADAPDWITISPDHGDAAGTYTLKITLEPNTTAETREARITITCGTSKIEIIITQTGSGTPEDPDDPSIDPSPQSKWLVSRIDCFVVDEDDEWSVNFAFEYDQDRRLTKLLLDDITNSGYNIAYPDSRTIMIENLPIDNREFYTVTLDEKGRAEEVAVRYTGAESGELRQTYAYDANGYCTASDMYNLNEKDLHSHLEFTWQSGNLTAVNGFDAEQEKVDYTLEYSGYKNDPKLVNLDLNAFFGAIPSADEFEGCSVILSMIDRTGLRSSNLSTDDRTSYVSYDGPLVGDWLTTRQAVPEPIVWTIDAEGRPDKAISSSIVTWVKINQKTGEVIPIGKSGTYTETYEFHYTE